MVVKGVVTHGRTLGRTLGFPTANIILDENSSATLPMSFNGVYASRVALAGVSYRAISNVGAKPTVGGNERTLETHILDFEGDIYGQTIEVELLQKIRDEIHFESLDALAAQIRADIALMINADND